MARLSGIFTRRILVPRALICSYMGVDSVTDRWKWAEDFACEVGPFDEPS